ncbi:MAG: RNA methyltransferase [Candidatus Margulisiibacteriota bacterium]
MRIGKNSKIAGLVKRLKEKKYRDKEGFFLIEGPHLVEEALKSAFGFELALFSEKAPKEIVAAVEEKEIPSYFVDNKTMSALSDTESDQGMIGVVPKFSFSAKDIKKENKQIVVVCDGVQDPGNLGTIIRTASAAGCGAVIASPDSADVYNPKTIRSTGGAIFHIPVIAGESIENTINFLAASGFKIFCAEPSGGKSLYTTDLSKSFVIVVGNEGRGVKSSVRRLCDGAITIPINKATESLNAAVAAAVILFEALRQRH